MNLTKIKTILAAIAVFAGIGAFVLLYIPLTEKVNLQTGIGTLKSLVFEKEHKEGSPSYGKHVGNEITVNDRFIVEVELENGKIARGTINPGAAQVFQIGQKVKVTYEVRGFKPIWEKIYVKSIEKLAN